MKELFSGVNGKWSSKRVIGTLIFVVILAQSLMEQLLDKPINMSVFMTLSGSAALMIGVGVLEKKSE